MGFKPSDFEISGSMITNNKRCEAVFLPKTAKALFKFVENKPTDEVIGFTVECVCIHNRFEKFVLKVLCSEKDSLLNHADLMEQEQIPVILENLCGKYWQKGSEWLLSVKATGWRLDKKDVSA